MKIKGEAHRVNLSAQTAQTPHMAQTPKTPQTPQTPQTPHMTLCRLLVYIPPT
jgi:hypothetical protein